MTIKWKSYKHYIITSKLFSIKLSSKPTKNNWLKNGERIQIEIFPKTHEKVLNIPKHLENVNLNHNEILPHTCQSDY